MRGGEAEKRGRGREEEGKKCICAWLTRGEFGGGVCRPNQGDS